MRSSSGKYRFWLLLGGILAIFSCTEIIEIELDSTYRRLVVYGTVTTDSLRHRVELSKTGDYFSNEPPEEVTGARVTLSFNGTVIQMQEEETAPGLYMAPVAFRGLPGTTYQLEISQVDVDGDNQQETYRASSTMPLGGAPLDSIRLEYFDAYFVSGYQVFMYALDPPTREWYGLKYQKNSDLLTDTLIKYFVQSDDFYNGRYLFYGAPIGFFSDDDPRERLEKGDTVTLELNSIEKPYFEFVNDARLEIYGNNPLFSGPPSNVSSNIDNGAQGIFTAYSVERASVVVE